MTIMPIVGFHKGEHFFVVKNDEIILKSKIQSDLIENIINHYKNGKELFEVDGYFVQVLESAQGNLFNVRSLNQFSDSDFMNPLSTKVFNSISDGITICDHHGKILFQNKNDIEIVGINLMGRYAKDAMAEGLMSDSISMKVIESKEKNYV